VGGAVIYGLFPPPSPPAARLPVIRYYHRAAAITTLAARPTNSRRVDGQGMVMVQRIRWIITELGGQLVGLGGE